MHSFKENTGRASAPRAPSPPRTLAPPLPLAPLQRALGNRGFGDLLRATACGEAQASWPPLEEAAEQAELPAAQATCAKSRTVADSFARGDAKFPPVGYWFARLYQLITEAEIEARGGLQQPGFLLHFIPFFFEMYAVNVERYSAGMNQAITEAWAPYFAGLHAADAQVSEGFLGYGYIWRVTDAIFAAVSAHVEGDMAAALTLAYNTYHERYFDSKPFAEYHADFFERNRPIFDGVRLELVQELFVSAGAQPGLAITALTIGDYLGVGRSVDSIYRWRQTAWDEAAASISAAQEQRRAGRRFGGAPPQTYNIMPWGDF